jgi:formate dehydrogenase subunit gamma
MTRTFATNRDGRRRSLLLLLSLLLGLALAPSLTAEAPGPISVPNPGSDLWRAVRERQAEPPPGQLPARPDTLGVAAGLGKSLIDPAPAVGTTQARGVDSEILINSFGEDWRHFRMNQLIPIGGYLLLGTLGGLGLIAAVRGRVGVDGGDSGQLLQRFSDFQRVLHWFLAGVFIFMALSGLILLFGRALLLPLLGPETFSVLASASKEGHNLFGPLFLAALVVLFFTFAARNLYARGDFTWLIRGGGMLGVHASAGFFNMGEKIWFWLVILGGLVISVSGFTLLFPNLGTGRTVMELALMVHAVAALVLILAAFGHVYLGTYGTEGTLRGMITGYVDLNWGRSHHDRWAKQAEERGEVYEPAGRVWKPDQSEQETP